MLRIFLHLLYLSFSFGSIYGTLIPLQLHQLGDESPLASELLFYLIALNSALVTTITSLSCTILLVIYKLGFFKIYQTYLVFSFFLLFVSYSWIDRFLYLWLISYAFSVGSHICYVVLKERFSKKPSLGN